MTFWDRMDRRGGEDACWPWKGSRGRTGYGRLRPQANLGDQRLAHRAAWTLARGPIPAGLRVLHSCDNRACCNPRHLFLGTQADNMADCKRKGRAAAGDRNGTRTRPDRVRRGERSGRAKLTAADVCAIRREAASGALQREIAARYGIDRSVVSRIVAGLAWRPLEGP
jgi:hypothetical protein